MTKHPRDPSDRFLNVQDPKNETPLADTDQYQDEPNNWMFQRPHHPNLRGPLGTFVKKLMALVNGPERRSSAP